MWRMKNVAEEKEKSLSSTWAAGKPVEEAWDDNSVSFIFCGRGATGQHSSGVVWGRVYPMPDTGESTAGYTGTGPVGATAVYGDSAAIPDDRSAVPMGEFNDSGGTGVVWNRAGNSGQLFADVGGFGRNRIYFVGDTSAKDGAVGGADFDVQLGA